MPSSTSWPLGVVLALAALVGCPSTPPPQVYDTGGPPGRFTECPLELLGQLQTASEGTTAWVLFVARENSLMTPCIEVADSPWSRDEPDDAPASPSSVFLTWTEDAGRTFRLPQRLSNGANQSAPVHLAARGQRVVVAMARDGASGPEVVVLESADRGATWDDAQVLTAETDAWRTWDRWTVTTTGDVLAGGASASVPVFTTRKSAGWALRPGPGELGGNNTMRVVGDSVWAVRRDAATPGCEWRVGDVAGDSANCVAALPHPTSSVLGSRTIGGSSTLLIARSLDVEQELVCSHDEVDGAGVIGSGRLTTGAACPTADSPVAGHDQGRFWSGRLEGGGPQITIDLLAETPTILLLDELTGPASDDELDVSLSAGQGIAVRGERFDWIPTVP